jgi:Tol biopolymer transport system component
MRVAVVTLAALLALGVGRASAGPSALASGAIAFERDIGKSSDIYITEAAGEATPVVATPAEEFQPALSPRGRLAFVRVRGGSSDILALIGGRETLVTDDAAIDNHPAWSPTETKLAYASNSGKGFEIKVVRVGDPRSARVVAPAPGDDIAPAYSPSGRDIAFASNRSGNWDLYRLTDERRLTRLTTTSAEETNASWSPDATRLAFTRTDPKGNSDVYVLTLATRALLRITAHAAADYDPTWSPTGAELAFVSDRGGEPAIWSVSARGGKATPVSRPLGGIDLGPSWGPRAPSRIVRAPASALQSIVCPSPPAQFAGTAGPDNIPGTANDDVICGRDGADTIQGLGGRDKLAGGNHGDVVTGGDVGDEIVSGGAGNDRVEGNLGSDTYVSGGTGSDTILGGDGDDKLFNQDASADTVNGGAGYDRRQTDSSPADTVSNCEGWI